jgi:hypothetical protein
LPSVRAESSQLTTTIPARQRSLHDPVPGQWMVLACQASADLADELPDAQAIIGLLGIIADNGNLGHAKATA